MKPVKLETTQSSLLIPEKFLEVFVEKTSDLPREIYLHYLLKRYRSVVLSGTFAKSEKVKTCYQDKGQNLVKKNLRPFNPDWLELGILSNWLGISRTALFTWFLILDLAGWDTILREKFFDSGVPPKISSIRLVSYLAKRKTVRADKYIRHKLRL